MYRTLIGKQRSLVFPVMCNAFVKIDYQDNIPDTGDDDTATQYDEQYGLWAHDGSFTIETTLTPYDVNGFGTEQSGSSLGNVYDSEKTMPAISGDANQQSDEYLEVANREDYVMRVFKSDNVYIDLINVSDHTQNSPAEYKIKFTLINNSTTVSIESDKVITAGWGKTPIHTPTSGDVIQSGFDSAGLWKYTQITYNDTIPHSAAASTFTTNLTAQNYYYVGQELFIRDGFTFTSIGTVTNVNSGTKTITLSGAIADSFTGTGTVYSYAPKEALYIENLYHIAVNYNTSSMEMNIYLNGKNIATGNHTKSTFTFGNSDMYIGANGTGTVKDDQTSVSNNQFMGEIHEFAILNTFKKQFASVFTLTPRYDELLLYLRFEESDI